MNRWIKGALKVAAAAAGILAADGLLTGQVEMVVQAVVAALAVFARAPKDE